MYNHIEYRLLMIIDKGIILALRRLWFVGSVWRWFVVCQDSCRQCIVSMHGDLLSYSEVVASGWVYPCSVRSSIYVLSIWDLRLCMVIQLRMEYQVLDRFGQGQ